MKYLRSFFPKSVLVTILVALTSFAFVAQAEEQTPWQDLSVNSSLQTNMMWPGYNTGFEFTVLADGAITQLGGFFNGLQTVRLYRIPETSSIRQVDVSDSNNWSYANITPLQVSAGERYTVAVQTGFSFSTSIAGAGPSFPNLPQAINDIRVDGPVFTMNNSIERPTWGLHGQMWGQPDIVFVPGEVVIQ